MATCPAHAMGHRVTSRHGREHGRSTRDGFGKWSGSPAATVQMPRPEGCALPTSTVRTTATRHAAALAMDSQRGSRAARFAMDEVGAGVPARGNACACPHAHVRQRVRQDSKHVRSKR